MRTPSLADEIRTRISSYLGLSATSAPAHETLSDMCRRHWPTDTGDLHATLALALLEQDYGVRFPNGEALDPFLHLSYKSLAAHIEQGRTQPPFRVP